MGARRDEPAAGERQGGNAEGAEQLQPDCDNASLAGLRLVATKPYQGLQTDRRKDDRDRRTLRERPRLHAAAVDTPGTDAKN